jgi:2-polyprenyl-6-methoxyphenol hydroxylase-like FAD-dependent oxidoreductase
VTTTVGAAVLGSGPAALAHALFRARHEPVVLAGRPEVGAPGVERVPAPLLTLLLELGIVPAELDVDRLTRTRLVAWEEPDPVERDGPACAHLDRTALVDALWRRVRACPEAQVVPPVVRAADVAGGGGRWAAGRVVDATGRRALTAATRVRPAPVWVAACCTVPRRDTDPTMRLAAAPTGYAYRLGSARWLTVGWVGPGDPPRDGAGVADRIASEGVGWLCDDLDLSGAPVVRRAASVSISGGGEDPRIVRIGDAAVARDALASQGTSIGLSDARLAADADVALHDRRADGLERHLRHLAGMLATCAHRRSGPWLAYRGWVEQFGVRSLA